MGEQRAKSAAQNLNARPPRLMTSKIDGCVSGAAHTGNGLPPAEATSMSGPKREIVPTRNGRSKRPGLFRKNAQTAARDGPLFADGLSANAVSLPEAVSKHCSPEAFGKSVCRACSEAVFRPFAPLP